MLMIKYLSIAALCFIGGAFYASSFPFQSGKFFVLGSTLGFFLLTLALNHSLKKRDYFLSSAFFNLGFGVVGFYWIGHLLSEFGGMEAPINYIAATAFYFLLAPQVYLFAMIWYFANKKNLLLGHHLFPILFALFYTVLEILVPQQFPAHLGHTFLNFISYGGLKLAPVFGAGFYSFVVAWFALEIARLISFRRFNPSFLLLLVVVIADFTYSSATISTSLPVLNIRMVQPNIGNFLKLNSEAGGRESMREVYDTYYSLSVIETTKKIDLVIWPETSWPTLQSSEQMEKFKNVQPFFRNLVEKTNADLFFGGYDQRTSIDGFEIENQYNAAFYLKKDGSFSGVYHKMRLIPFGETLPFGPLNKKLSELIKNVSFFAAGERFTLFETSSGQNFISAICYEILFSDFIREYLNKQTKPVNFIVNLTNDSWYGDSSEPKQHLFLAKWRAIEFNLPIVRSTNTGITTIIYPDGTNDRTLGVNEKAIIDLELKLKDRKPTFFEIYGNLSLYILIGILLVVHCVLNLVKNKYFPPKTHKKNITDGLTDLGD